MPLWNCTELCKPCCTEGTAACALMFWALSDCTVVNICSAGAVLQCLRSHRTSLSSECRKEELKLGIIQSQDIRLQPTLHKQCSEEIAVFCPNVEPGSTASHSSVKCNALTVVLEHNYM